MELQRLVRSTVVGAVAAMALIAGSQVAQATPTGSVSITETGGTITGTPSNDINTATSIMITGASFVTQSIGTGDFSGIGANTAVTFNMTTFTVYPLGSGQHMISPALMLTVDGYTFNLDEEITTVNHHETSPPTSTLTLGFIGTVNGNGLMDSASAQLTFGQDGGVSADIGFSGSLAHPNQVPVPEPATIALLGASLVGLGFVRRRG